MTYASRFIITALLPMYLIGSACSHTIPQASTKPVPPPISSAVPTFAALTKEQPKAPVSQLPLQIKADLTPIQTALRDAIPERFTESGHQLEKDFRWTFVRTGTPEVRIQDGMAAIHAEYKGDIETRGGAQACRLDPIYATLDATGKVVLIQRNESLAFGFEPTHVTTGLKPESDASCNMFNVPVKDQLAELFSLSEAKAALARTVQPETFGLPLQRVWDDLQGPLVMPVSNFNTKACYYGHPRELTLGPQKGTLQDTTIAAVAKEMPVVGFEQSCEEPAPTTALINTGTIPAEPKPFSILARIPVSYASLSQQLQSKLFHQSFPLEGAEGETAVIEQITASDANGRILLAVETSGDLKGTTYYWGTPRLEDNGKSLSIPDLQMANESRTAIDSIRLGYWQTVDRGLKNRLRQAVSTDFSAQINRLKQVMTGKHTSGNTTMDVLITGQQPDQAYSTPQALVATVLMQGTASAASKVAVEGTSVTRNQIKGEVR